MSAAQTPSRRPILVFPGQGSYSRQLLRELLLGDFGLRPRFESADADCRRMLGGSLLEALAAPSRQEHDRYLASHPDLDQVGIFLGEALLAGLLLEAGVRPAALLGHSLGDLAALAAAGVFSAEEGARIVCQRVLCLRTVGTAGRMAALSTDHRSVAALLAELGAGAAEIAVVNHGRQTVVSGPEPLLEGLVEPLARRRISLTMLKSRYPFHSSYLAAAMQPFEIALRGYRLRPAAHPVYLSTEGRLLAPDDDLPALLARQFTRRLDFQALVAGLEAEHRSFVECGDGGGLLRILGKCLPPQAGATFDRADPQAGGVAGLRERLRAAPIAAAAARRTAVREHPSPPAAAAPATELGELPVAVVAAGCVLPGAGDPDEFWHNVLTGVSGIVDLAELDPVGSADFLVDSPQGEPRPVSDKTYTLLNGAIPEVPFRPLLEPWYPATEFERLTKAQRLLAVALAQCLDPSRPLELPPPLRMRCILGATADGFVEHDEAMVLQAMRAQVARLGLAPDLAARVEERLGELLARGAGEASGLGQHAQLDRVVAALLPGGVRSFVVDTACSSSLYAIDLGIKELARGSADLVFAGGVFAPGPANNTLFAQFRGLTPNGSRPLDAGADGVVFGDGAAMVVLKRLDDALAAGDRVLGVIRAIGLSSDGKSPSINVPRSHGQSLAIRRAYRDGAVPVETIQYIEAHATATPVGDAVEFRSLSEIFGGRPKSAAKIELGSVKALIGHTGWVSGAASLIKILKAFEHRSVPPQHNFETPPAELGLEQSPFTIATESRPWRPNVDGLPRRAGINGFGFGGTNAHLVVEEFDPGYHRRLASPAAAPAPELAVVDVAGLFPDDGSLGRPLPGPVELFDRARLALPAGKILLPDVVEHMDPSQFLAVLGADQILARLAPALPALEADVAVVLGLESKTERGVLATQRVFLDRLTRLLGERRGGWPEDEVGAVERAIEAARAEVIPSGPYTLPGLMPNVAASRISSLFDLKAPNLVIDRGAGSLPQAIAVAAELLADGDCRLALAGGINSAGATFAGHHEGLVLLALTLPETAEELGLTVLFRCSTELTEGGATPLDCRRIAAGGRGASGAGELIEALRLAESGRQVAVAEPQGAGMRPVVRLAPATAAEAAPGAAREPAAPPPAAAPTASGADPQPAAQPAHAYDFVQATPIHRMTPRLRPLPAESPPAALAGRRVLLLADQPEWWRQARAAGVADAGEWTVVSPAGAPIPGSLVVDLEAEPPGPLGELLAGRSFDLVLAVKQLSDIPAAHLLGDDPAGERQLLDLLFLTLKLGYRRLREERPAVVGLCLGGLASGVPHPYSGLFGGMLKSVARELPEGLCRAVCSDARDPGAAAHAVALELAQPPQPVEVFHLAGERHAQRLEPLARLAGDGPPALDGRSVVLATGGGRGVTAVLAEEMLERFGCTVVALGRTDPDSLPADLRQMSSDELGDFEAEFYRREMARPGARIPELKRRFAGYQSARELRDVIARCQALPGDYEYRAVDIGDPLAIAALIADLRSRHGRLDLVVHGAGVQHSQQLIKKSLADFRRIVGTKLDGLAHIHRAVLETFGSQAVAFHLLTSAFSYLGNDGQPDYGAANEAMNRLAAALGSPSARWSSMGWLGWAGIGMTRGSEFAALAARRRLRGVTREEGRQIFGELLGGPPAAAVNILLAEGEIAFYQPDVALEPAPPPAAAPRPPLAPPAPAPRHQRRPLEITLDRAPFLLDHTVQGIPTLPGAFIIGLAAEAALSLRPELKITSFENTSFQRFVRVYPEKGAQLNLDAEVVSEDDRETVVRFRLLADFVHQSGIRLRQDVVQTEIFVHLRDSLRSQPEGGFPRRDNGGLRLPDPYVMEGSPVRLDGRFVSMSEVQLDNGLRRASYSLAQPGNGGNGGSRYDYLLPNLVMVDAFWRFGTVQPVGPGALAVYVPERCRRMAVFFDYGDFSQQCLLQPVAFAGANPRSRGDQLAVGPIEARTAAGRLLLTVEGGVCRRFGVIENAF